MDEKLQLFGTTPLQEPEIYEIYLKGDSDEVFGVTEGLLDLIEKRVGSEVDFEFVGKVVHRIFDKRDADGNFKRTEKTENIEPLKPRDSIAFLRFMRDNEPTTDEAIEWLFNKTNIPNDLDQWEKSLVVTQFGSFGFEGVKTAIGIDMGN